MDVCRETCEWTDRCYGVDETPAGPVVVLAVRQGRKVVVEEVAAWPVQGPYAVAAGLTEKEAWVRRLQTPLRSKSKVLRVLPGLLEAQLPFGIDECMVSCVRLFRSPKTTGLTAVVAVVRRTDLQSRLGRSVAEGREPHVLDQEGLALWTQAADECPPHQADELRVVIYLGLDRATLVFGRGSEWMSTQGLRRFEPGQVIRQARLIFDGDPRPVFWIWTGPGAGDATAMESIRRIMDRSEPVQERVMKDPRTVLARAYAVRALTPGPLRCDFRMDSFAHGDVQRLRIRREFSTAMIWLVAGVILLSIGMGWKGWLEKREARARQAVAGRARAVMTRLGGGQAINPGYEIRSVSNALAGVEAQYAPFVRAVSPSRSRALGRILMAAREGNIILYRVAWEDTRLKVEGVGASEMACRAFVRLVEAEAGLTTVCRTTKKDEHGFRFVMETTGAR